MGRHDAVIEILKKRTLEKEIDKMDRSLVLSLSLELWINHIISQGFICDMYGLE